MIISSEISIFALSLEKKQSIKSFGVLPVRERDDTTTTRPHPPFMTYIPRFRFLGIRCYIMAATATARAYHIGTAGTKWGLKEITQWRSERVKLEKDASQRPPELVGEKGESSPPGTKLHRRLFGAERSSGDGTKMREQCGHCSVRLRLMLHAYACLVALRSTGANTSWTTRIGCMGGCHTPSERRTASPWLMSNSSSNCEHTVSHNSFTERAGRRGAVTDGSLVDGRVRREGPRVLLLSKVRTT